MSITECLQIRGRKRMILSQMSRRLDTLWSQMMKMSIAHHRDYPADQNSLPRSRSSSSPSMKYLLDDLLYSHPARRVWPGRKSSTSVNSKLASTSTIFQCDPLLTSARVVLIKPRWDYFSVHLGRVLSSSCQRRRPVHDSRSLP